MQKKAQVFDEAFSFNLNALGHCKAGCLLIHGFTGSPSEMKPLGEFLSAKGYGVYGVRLKGHGTSPEDMATTDWKDWYESVQQGMQEVKGKFEKVFVIGLSMGGLLALQAGLEYQPEGVVAINAPIYIRNKYLRFLPFLQLFKKFHFKQGGDNFKNRFSYDRIPLECLSSLVELVTLVKKQVLPNFTRPILVVQSKEDKTLWPKSGQYIYDSVASKDKDLLWLSTGGHVATIGDDISLLYTEIASFLQKTIGEEKDGSI